MLDFCFYWWYNKYVLKREVQELRNRPHKVVRKKLKNFKKTLDKHSKVCYNKYVR